MVIVYLNSPHTKGVKLRREDQSDACNDASTFVTGPVDGLITSKIAVFFRTYVANFYVYAFVAWLFAHIGQTYLSTMFLCLLIFNTYHLLVLTSSKLIAAGTVFIGICLLSSFTYLFGQFFIAVSGSTANIFGYLAICLLYKSQSKKLAIKFRLRYKPTYFVPLATLFFIGSIPISKIINLLGFGYDNYAHITVVRKILIDQQLYLSIPNPSGVPAFTAHAPMGSHAFFAFFAQLVGISGSEYKEFLRFFLFQYVLLIFFFIWVAFIMISRNLGGRIRPFFAFVILILTIGYSYPSHIWYSGYFSSNFATVLVLLAIGIMISGENILLRAWLLLALTGFVVYCYPLYTGFCLVALAGFMRIEYKKVYFGVIHAKPKHQLVMLVSQGYVFIVAAVTYYALATGFGSGYFLVPGGIQALPFGTTMFMFGISLAIFHRRQMGNWDNQFVSIAVYGSVAIACSGILYAYVKMNVPGEQFFAPYYPTKIAITGLIVVIIFLIRFLVIKEEERSNLKSFFDGRRIAVVIALAALYLGSMNEWPFSQGYMGSTRGVISSISSSKPEVVDGEKIQIAVAYSLETNKPVLYLSDRHESELNTRWINSLLFQWNDANWGDWMNARQLLDDEKFDEATALLNGKFVLVIDEYGKFINNPASFRDFRDLCVIDVVHPNDCR